MKRTTAILVLGLLLGIAGFVAPYCVRTARLGEDTAHGELAWLKTEFNLSEGEFESVRNLHEKYLPGCARQCARIAAANADLKRMVGATNQVSPEIAAKLAEIAKIRLECQTEMLAHFYSVSRAMPGEQGRRYLERMQQLTSLGNMREHPASAPQVHGH